MNLKKLLKNLKLNEESISMFLGGLVIVIVGILVVNYFKDKNPQTLPEAQSTQAPVTAAVGKEHTVTKGETLWSIAQDAYGSGYNWTDVYSANKLKSQKIEVGQKLSIPEVSAKKATVEKSKPVVKEPVKAEETQKASADSYTVVKGDNLWKISVKEYGDGYKWASVAKANKIVNPNVIHPGNVLTLPR